MIPVGMVGESWTPAGVPKGSVLVDCRKVE